MVYGSTLRVEASPLKWAAPVIIVAKILLQELWLLKNDWDARLDQYRKTWYNID